jgi:hypothetical protein
MSLFFSYFTRQLYVELKIQPDPDIRPAPDIRYCSGAGGENDVNAVVVKHSLVYSVQTR